MAEYLARTNPKIYFATMHPGWSDTPAVQTSMPSFREKMINKLRTPEQGADTLVWMCCVDNIEKFPNGSFFQGSLSFIFFKFIFYMRILFEFKPKN